MADGTPEGPARLDLEKAEAQGALDLTPVPGLARGEVWLHNRGLGNLGDIRLRCSELLAHDGHVISSAAIQFDPEMVPMPGRSSRGVTDQSACRPGGSAGEVLRHSDGRGLPGSRDSGCRHGSTARFMTDTADRADPIAGVEDQLRKVGKVVRRAMLDAIPDGEPVRWLYAPMREYPSRPARRCDRRSACRRAVHSEAKPRTFSAWPWRSR